MSTFSVVTPTRLTLPAELGLLLAPVQTDEPGPPDPYVGRAEGVLLDEDGHILAFVVRLSPWLAAGSPRTVVAATAVNTAEDGVLHLSWSADNLLAQPRIDGDGKRGETPATSGLVPPGEGLSGDEVVKRGLEGTAAGAVLGVLAGLALAGPVGALALGGFFALGGGIEGIIAGASRETPGEAGEAIPEGVSPEHVATLRKLESHLRDPGFSGFLHEEHFNSDGTPR